MKICLNVSPGKKLKAMQWCNEFLGFRAGRWETYANTLSFYFKREEDAVLFALKWC